MPEPQTDMSKKCKCLEQFGNLGQTMYTINDLMVEESIEKVYFILNGNNQAHKSTAAILAAQMKNLNKNLTSYLSYYSHNEDGSASAFYKWDDQCHQDQCAIAETILGTTNIEQHQGAIYGITGYGVSSPGMQN